MKAFMLGTLQYVLKLSKMSGVLAISQKGKTPSPNNCPAVERLQKFHLGRCVG